MKEKSLSTDRLVAGGLAGMAGALVQNAYGTTMKALGLTDRTFIDFASIIVTYRIQTGFVGYILASLTHLAMCMILGVLFAYIIKSTSSRYCLLKGLGFGFGLWFFLSGLGSIFKLPEFTEIPTNVAFVILGGALIFGIVTAYILTFLERKTSLL